MTSAINNISAWGLAVLMIVFGLNKFLGFASVEPPLDPIAQSFLGAMFSSYLAPVVGLVEIVGGLLLLVPKTRFIGCLLLLPIIFNIVAFHLAHDFVGNGIWLVPSLLFIALGYFNKHNFYTLLKS